MQTLITGIWSTPHGLTLTACIRWREIPGSYNSDQVGAPMPMPQQMTICMRTFHYTFVFPKSSYAFAFFFGSLLPVDYSYHAFDMHYTTDMAGASLNLWIFGKVIYHLWEELLQDWSDMDEGWLYGEWETGPWWAFHTKVFFSLKEYTFHQKWILADAVIENCFGLDRFGSFWNEMHLKQSNKQRPTK